MKRIFALILTLTLAVSLCGCGEKKSGEAVSFSFSDSIDIETIQKLAGKTVSIIGYMATLSPVSGKYMYLMNMPYQSCPFCVPNTSKLANTMAVYAPSGKTFDYTDQAIRVTGRLEVGSFTDDYSYEYGYRIADAAYEVVDLSTISKDYALWYSIASDGIVADVSAMFDYVHFVCQWTEYTSYYIDEDGSRVEYFLYPGDAENYLADTGAYGYSVQSSESYFPSLIQRVKAISDTGLEDLIAIIEGARKVEAFARSELAQGHYTYDAEIDKYFLTADAALYEQFYEQYDAFSAWLAKWEL